MKKSGYTVWVFFFLWLCSCSNNANPPDNINTRASFQESGKFSTAGLKIIASFINKKAGTMSTLYGNALALKKSIDLNKALAGGELFTLVTWKQQPDEHWFGANIPGDLQSVEVLRTDPNGGNIDINYQRYEGKEFVLSSDTLHKIERIRFILDQRPSVMP